MQSRIRNNEHSTASTGSTSRYRKVSSALFVASSVLLALPTTCEAFVPSSFPQHMPQSSTTLFYTMPDVTHMKAAEMRQELESYGINTHQFFDQREFEQALIEARRNYEQTLNDVMSSSRPKEKKKVQTGRRTVNYDRSRHQDERIYSSDVNDPIHGDNRRQEQDDFYRHRRQYHQAEPNPVGNFNTYPNTNGPKNMGGNRRRPGNEWFNEDPLFAHEKQAQHFRPRDAHVHYDSSFDEYEVNSRQPQARATYNDPAMEMKYQTALQESYNMKVEVLQHELNCRGISTKYCMIFRDFCIEYAKAIAEDKEKVSDEPSAKMGDDDEGDYDPSYKDVVMQKYDPSMWI